MAEELYTLDAASLRRLRDMLAWYERGGDGAGKSLSREGGSDDAGWGKITSNAGSIGADYTVRLQRSGSSGTGGLTDLDAVDRSAENLWEGLSGGNAGYEATSVTGLKRIPVGAFVRCYWATKSGTRKLIFSERNEPICT